MEPIERKIVLGIDYTVPNDRSLFVTAYPNEGEWGGSYEWEYYIDGAFLPGWQQWIFQTLEPPPKFQNAMLYFALGCGGCSVLMFFGILAYAVKYFKNRKKNKAAE